MASCQCSKIRACQNDISKLNGAKTKLDNVSGHIQGLSNIINSIQKDMDDTLYSSSMEDILNALSSYYKLAYHNYREACSDISRAKSNLNSKLLSYKHEDTIWHNRKRR